MIKSCRSDAHDISRVVVSPKKPVYKEKVVILKIVGALASEEATS